MVSFHPAAPTNAAQEPIRMLAAVIERRGSIPLCRRPAHKRHGALSATLAALNARPATARDVVHVLETVTASSDYPARPAILRGARHDSPRRPPSMRGVRRRDPEAVG